MKFHTGRVIAFYGIDGSGKTTLATLLADVLKARSYYVNITGIRAHHTLMHVIIRLIFWLKGFDYKSLENKPLHLNYIIRKHLRVRSFYTILEIIGVQVWFLLKLIPRAFMHRGCKRIIIADRYIPDFAAMLAFTSSINNSCLIKLIWFLEKFTCVKPLYFYVHVDPYLSLNRKKDECLTMSFCNYMALKYQYINKFLHPILVDTTNRKPTEIMIDILEELRKNHLLDK
jgi:energy-coupling factor transporter ATP-binding protein EcfA2